MATTVLPRPKAYDDTFFKPISLWLTTTNHKLIGIMYMVTGILSFVIGGIFALIIRLQLSQPNMKVVDAETYNQLISAHGVTMIFFFVTIFLTGIANYMVPIMIGPVDMAFPRVNLLGFWLVPVSILLYYSGFFTGGALDAGWTGYPPLTEQAYQNHSLGVDFWALSIIVWAISGIMASTNFLTTIVAPRATGMRFSRLPLFVWAQISTSILLLVVGAPLAAAMILLEFDRQLGTQFFTTAGRAAGPVPAPVLVLRPPRGLHHDSARLRHDLRDHPGVRAQADLWLHVDGRRALRHRLPLDDRLGASHVHGRHECLRRGLLHADDDAHRRADGHQVLQLDRDRMVGLDRVHRADEVRIRLHGDVPHRWIDRDLPRLSAGRHAAPPVVLRGRPSPLRAVRRQR